MGAAFLGQEGMTTYVPLWCTQSDVFSSASSSTRLHVRQRARLPMAHCSGTRALAEALHFRVRA